MKRIYVASSWRNQFQPQVVEMIKNLGIEVYDFRHPEGRSDGFHWDNISHRWLDWSVEEYRDALSHPIAKEGFRLDYEAMLACDACVLVLPCGRSAHTEAGWFAGKGLPVYVLSPIKQEPELMYKLFDNIFASIDELQNFLQVKKERNY